MKRFFIYFWGGAVEIVVADKCVLKSGHYYFLRDDGYEIARIFSPDVREVKEEQ